MYFIQFFCFSSVVCCSLILCFVSMASKSAVVQKYTGVGLSGAVGGVNTSSITLNAAVLESLTGVNKML